MANVDKMFGHIKCLQIGIESHQGEEFLESNCQLE